MKEKVALPLALLDAAEEGRIEGRTRFHKLVFLLQEEGITHLPEKYQFRPDNYGPYSRELSRDLNSLKRDGDISVEVVRAFNGSEKYIYEITTQGNDKLNDLFSDQESWLHGMEPRIKDAAAEIIHDYNTTRLFDLLDHVYDEYPDMAEKSIL